MINELFAEFWRLSKMSAIPNMEVYAQRWYILAARMGSVGCVSTAETCIKQWRRYMNHPGGVYVRTADRSFAVLTQVSA